MTNRTLKEIDDEERQLRSRLIELEVEIKHHPERHPFMKAQELNRILSGQGKRLHELENEKEAIGLKLQALNDEEVGGEADEEVDVESSGLRATGYGEFKTILDKLIRRDGIKENETVPSTKINAWIREYEKQGIKLVSSSIRKKLSDLGYSTERKPEE